MTTGYIEAVNYSGRGNNGGFTYQLTVPAAVQVGDVLIAVIADNNGTPAVTTAGWTSIPGSPAGDVAAYYKIAVASDIGATVSFTGDIYQGYFSCGLVAYRSPSASPIDVFSKLSGRSVPSVATSSADDLLVYVWFADYGTITTPAGLTSRYSSAGMAVADVVQVAVGASAVETATGPGNWLSGFAVALRMSSAPATPTITSPGNSAYIDTSTTGLPVTAQYNSTDGAVQNAYAARVKVAGASSYSYLNVATDALQSTIVWNPNSTAPGGSWSFTFPAAAVADGYSYNLSCASQEAQSNLQGPFAADITVNAQLDPALTVTYPAGTVDGASPALSYTVTPAPGASITGGRWLIYPTAVSSPPGFTINIGTGTIPAGAVSDVTWTGNPLTVAAQSGVTLTPGGYTAYAAVQETGAEWSSTVPSAFTVAFDPPAQPSLTAVASTDPTTGAPTVTVTVTGHDNVVSAADASFEGSLGTWTAGANTSIALSSAEALDGTESLLLTATAVGNLSAQSGLYQI